MQSVIVAESHSTVRQGLVELLQLMPEARVIGEAATRQELLTKCRAAKWDAVALGMWGSWDGALEDLRLLCNEWPGLRVIILGCSIDSERIKLCVKHGLAGYVADDDIAEEFGSALHAVLSGERYFSKAVTAVLGH